MENNIIVGSKVCIPKKKSTGAKLERFHEDLRNNSYYERYLVVENINGIEASLKFPTGYKEELYSHMFLLDDLELYEEVKPIILNSTSDKYKEEFNRLTEPKAMRFNESKPKVSLIHNESLMPLVKVLEFGAKKYDRFNWQKPMNKLEILESMKRHVDELIDRVNAGESELDSESNEHIVGHIFSNCMFYSYHNVISKDDK